VKAGNAYDAFDKGVEKTFSVAIMSYYIFFLMSFSPVPSYIFQSHALLSSDQYLQMTSQ